MKQRIRSRAAQVVRCSAAMAVGLAMAPSANDAEGVAAERRARDPNPQRTLSA
jgi:hypothetical protein